MQGNTSQHDEIKRDRRRRRGGHRHGGDSRCGGRWVFLARGGMLGDGAQTFVARQLVSLGLAVPPAPMMPAPSAQEIDPAQGSSVAPETAVPDERDPGFVLAPPKLEVARFDMDGSGIVAASAQAGVEVQVLLDGQVLDSQTVPAAGEFVSFVTITSSTEPRVLSLLARFDGREMASEDNFILGPIRLRTAEADEEWLPLERENTPQPEVAAPEEAVAPVVAAPAQEHPVETADTFVAENTADTDASPTPQNAAGVPNSDEAPASDSISAEVVNSAASETQPALDTDVLAEAVSDDAVLPAGAGSRAQTVSTSEVADGVPAASAVPVASDLAASDPDQRDGALSDANPQPQQLSSTELKPTADHTTVEAGGDPAPQSDGGVTVLRAGKDGVTLLQPATPVAPELVNKVALDTISYTETGDVQLAGRAQPEALVRVYLDNSPVTDIATASDGRWSTALTSVAPGIYTLRLDEISLADGSVSSRLETPFKREAPEVLQPALEAGSSPDASAPALQVVTVQEGDSLWAISQERYGSGFLYVRVFDANKSDIRDPDLIYPGQIFTLPK